MPYLVAMPNKKLPDDVAEIIREGGRGVALGWVPQQSVLKHKVSSSELYGPVLMSGPRLLAGN